MYRNSLLMVCFTLVIAASYAADMKNEVLSNFAPRKAPHKTHVLVVGCVADGGGSLVVEVSDSDSASFLLPFDEQTPLRLGTCIFWQRHFLGIFGGVELRQPVAQLHVSHNIGCLCLWCTVDLVRVAGMESAIGAGVVLVVSSCPASRRSVVTPSSQAP